MRAICTRKDLYYGVQTVSRAIPGRSAWPILNNILIRTEENSIRLTAFDLELGIECTVPATIIESGALTVPARYTTEILTTFPEADINISCDEENTVTIKSGRSEYALLGLPSEEFRPLPEIADENSFQIDQQALKDIIRQTIFATSTEESRAILAGIHMSLSSGVLKFAGTDTHRLAVRTAPAASSSGEAACIIPRRALDEVSRLISDDETPISISIADSQIKFTVNGVQIVSRLIEGQFPNFERIIPKDHERRLTIPKDSFLSGVKRSSIIARENQNRLTIKTEGDQLILTAESSEVGKAHEELEIVKEGEDIEIIFNFKYILDFLNSVDSEGIFFDMKGPLESATMKPVGSDDYLYVLMPMHIV